MSFRRDSLQCSQVRHPIDMQDSRPQCCRGSMLIREKTSSQSGNTHVKKAIQVYIRVLLDASLHRCIAFFLLAEVYLFRTALGKQSAKNVASVSVRHCKRVRIARLHAFTFPLLSREYEAVRHGYRRRYGFPQEQNSQFQPL